MEVEDNAVESPEVLAKHAVRVNRETLASPHRFHLENASTRKKEEDDDRMQIPAVVMDANLETLENQVCPYHTKGLVRTRDADGRKVSEAVTDEHDAIRVEATPLLRTQRDSARKMTSFQDARKDSTSVMAEREGIRVGATRLHANDSTSRKSVEDASRKEVAAMTVNHELLAEKKTTFLRRRHPQESDSVETATKVAASVKNVNRDSKDVRDRRRLGPRDPARRTPVDAHPRSEVAVVVRQERRTDVIVENSDRVNEVSDTARNSNSPLSLSTTQFESFSIS